MAMNFTQLDQANNRIPRPTHARTTLTGVNDVSTLSPHRPQTLNMSNTSLLNNTENGLGRPNPNNNNVTYFGNLNNNINPIRYPNLGQPAQRVPFNNLSNNIANNNNTHATNTNNISTNPRFNTFNDISGIPPTQETNRIDRVLHEMSGGDGLKRRTRQNPRIPGRRNDYDYSKQMLNRLERPLSPRQTSTSSSGSSSIVNGNNTINNTRNNNNNTNTSNRQGQLFQSLRTGGIGGYGNINRNNRNINNNMDNIDENLENNGVLPRDFKFTQPKRVSDSIYVNGLNKVNNDNNENAGNNDINEDDHKSPERTGSRSKSVRSQSGASMNENNNNSNGNGSQRGSGMKKLNELAISRIKANDEINGKVVNKRCISVIGFPSSDFSYIHEQFRVFGQIEECRIEKNTMNIWYSNEIEAQRALDKNCTWIVHDHYEYMIAVQYSDNLEKKRNGNSGNVTFGYQRAAQYDDGRGIPIISRDDTFGTKMWHFLTSGW